jgi:heat shock protein HslJ
MQLEDKFLSVLAEVSGVYLDGKELILVDKSGQKVARLKARKLR